MEFNVNKNTLLQNHRIGPLVNIIIDNEEKFHLQDSILYYNYPIFKDIYGNLIQGDILLLSKRYGIILLWYIDSESSTQENNLNPSISDFQNALFSKLLKNSKLREENYKLNIKISTVLFNIRNNNTSTSLPDNIIQSDEELLSFLQQITVCNLNDEHFKELIASIEGTKGIKTLKNREFNKENNNSKGFIANKIETEISTLDRQQRKAATNILSGVQRIRGLAGSGKTILLAMKAAYTHMKYPEAVIVYTFWTKSLYQLIKKLITRFYRENSDEDPNFDEKMIILHGWGGKNYRGVYSKICEHVNEEPLTYYQASKLTDLQPFEYACNKVLEKINEQHLNPIFDYMFIDEGQDFSVSFYKLCRQITKKDSVIIAYDELQTIFNTEAPTTSDIFGSDENGNPLGDFSFDDVLYKCYRNPKEIIICAHAIGFGLYSNHIVQMLENQQHWEDIGYKVIKGRFIADDNIEIERPDENSIDFFNRNINEIIQTKSYNNDLDECKNIVSSIQNDLEDGLRLDDILIIIMSNNNLKGYLNLFEVLFNSKALAINDVVTNFSTQNNFYLPNKITISTISKAKGNEAYMVYLVGIDDSYIEPKVKERNSLFVGMTRSKGWLRISGTGKGIENLTDEINKAKNYYPKLIFKYPSKEHIKIIKADLDEAARKEIIARKKYKELRNYYSLEEIEEMIEDEKKDLNK